MSKGKQSTLFQSWGQKKQGVSSVSSSSATTLRKTNSDRSSEVIDLCLDEEEDDDLLLQAMETEQTWDEGQTIQNHMDSDVCNISLGAESLNTSSLSQLSAPDGFDKAAGKLWIYPTNYPVRDYQFKIVQQALFKNTMVTLPTGLGKTFISAVVMYNFYRWYPQGKVVFMAPTKPLVAQQIEACYNIMGIPQGDTAEMTGNMSPTERKRVWQERRVFFLTPQVMTNDLSRGTCPAAMVKCLVIDEAHKALGNHAYCQVVKELIKYTDSFRILSLSATPGSDIKAVQQVLSNLLISHIEIRTEESADIKQYSHERKVDKIVVPLGHELNEVKKQYIRIMDVLVSRLKRNGVLYHRDTASLSKFLILKARDAFRQNPPQHLPRTQYGVLEGDFALTMSLYHGFELLQLYGLRALYSFLDGITSGDKGQSRTRTELRKNADFSQLMGNLQNKFSPGSVVSQTSGDPFMTGHPKIDKLQQVVLDHFNTFSAGDTDCSTRVMIFSQYRDSVTEITSMLDRHQPMVKAMSFIGQSSAGKSTKGFTQKEQLKVMKAFRDGGYNTLVSTCVGEEGLDIGEVDLIICFDASKSPIRLVQRMGRTGRKREGRIVMLVTEGKEEQIYNQSQYSKRSIHKAILNGAKSLHFYQGNPRMVPEGWTPSCHKMHITVKMEFQSKKSNNDSGKQTKIKMQSRKNKGETNEDGLITAEEYKELLEYHSGNWDDAPALYSRSEFTVMTNNDKVSANSSTDSSADSSSVSVLNKWLPWQNRLQHTFNVSHSTASKNFVELIQFVELQQAIGCDEDAYGNEMAVFLNEDDVLKPGESNNQQKSGIRKFCVDVNKDSAQSKGRKSFVPRARNKSTLPNLEIHIESDSDEDLPVVNFGRDAESISNDKVSTSSDKTDKIGMKSKHKLLSKARPSLLLSPPKVNKKKKKRKRLSSGNKTIVPVIADTDSSDFIDLDKGFPNKDSIDQSTEKLGDDLQIISNSKHTASDEEIDNCIPADVEMEDVADDEDCIRFSQLLPELDSSDSDVSSSDKNMEDDFPGVKTPPPVEEVAHIIQGLGFCDKLPFLDLVSLVDEWEKEQNLYNNRVRETVEESVKIQRSPSFITPCKVSKPVFDLHIKTHESSVNNTAVRDVADSHSDEVQRLPTQLVQVSSPSNEHDKGKVERQVNKNLTICTSHNSSSDDLEEGLITSPVFNKSQKLQQKIESNLSDVDELDNDFSSQAHFDMGDMAEFDDVEDVGYKSEASDDFPDTQANFMLTGEDELFVNISSQVYRPSEEKKREHMSKSSHKKVVDISENTEKPFIVRKVLQIDKDNCKSSTHKSVESDFACHSSPAKDKQSPLSGMQKCFIKPASRVESKTDSSKGSTKTKSKLESKVCNNDDQSKIDVSMKAQKSLSTSFSKNSDQLSTSAVLFDDSFDVNMMDIVDKSSDILPSKTSEDSPSQMTFTQALACVNDSSNGSHSNSNSETEGMQEGSESEGESKETAKNVTNNAENEMKINDKKQDKPKTCKLLSDSVKNVETVADNTAVDSDGSDSLDLPLFDLGFNIDDDIIPPSPCASQSLSQRSRLSQSLIGNSRKSLATKFNSTVANCGDSFAKENSSKINPVIDGDSPHTLSKPNSTGAKVDVSVRVHASKSSNQSDRMMVIEEEEADFSSMMCDEIDDLFNGSIDTSEDKSHMKKVSTCTSSESDETSPSLIKKKKTPFPEISKNNVHNPSKTVLKVKPLQRSNAEISDFHPSPLSKHKVLNSSTPVNKCENSLLRKTPLPQEAVLSCEKHSPSHVLGMSFQSSDSLYHEECPLEETSVSHKINTSSSSSPPSPRILKKSPIAELFDADSDDDDIIVRKKRKVAIIESPVITPSLQERNVSSEDDDEVIVRMKKKASIIESPADAQSPYRMGNMLNSPFKTPVRPGVSTKSKKNLTSGIVKKDNRKGEHCSVSFAQHLDNDDDDFDDRNISKLAHSTDISRSHNSSTKNSKAKSLGKKCQRKSPANVFIEEEAELSDDGHDSGDEYDGSDDDYMEDSFVTHEATQLSQNTRENQHAMYLKSIKSPHRGTVASKFRLQYNKYHDMDIFSQAPREEDEEESQYMMDSFIVNDDFEETHMTIGEEVDPLENEDSDPDVTYIGRKTRWSKPIARRKKPVKRVLEGRKRIRKMSDSSSEEEVKVDLNETVCDRKSVGGNKDSMKRSKRVIMSSSASDEDQGKVHVSPLLSESKILAKSLNNDGLSMTKLKPNSCKSNPVNTESSSKNLSNFHPSNADDDFCDSQEFVPSLMSRIKSKNPTLYMTQKDKNPSHSWRQDHQNLTVEQQREQRLTKQREKQEEFRRKMAEKQGLANNVSTIEGADVEMRDINSSAVQSTRLKEKDPNDCLLLSSTASIDSEYKPVIFMDTKEINGGQNIVSELRFKHNMKVVVAQLGSCDYVVSNRMGVDRQMWSEFSNGSNRNKLIERIQMMCEMYDRSCLIIETDPVKSGEKGRPLHWTKYVDRSLVHLFHSSVKIFFTDNQNHTASMLADLCQLEDRKNMSVKVPVDISESKRNLLKFYISLPKLSHTHALNLIHNFRTLSEFVSSSYKTISEKGCMSQKRALEVYNYVKRTFDTQLLPTSYH